MNKKKFVNENGPCWDGYKQVGMKMKSGREVPNCVPESVEMNEENEPTNPALWSRAKAAAKAKYDVYPSAYANAFASKWYKEKGGSWKTKSESISERFDKTHLDMLKQAYSNINKINPNSAEYNRLVTMLDKLSKDELKQIADADIKFLSLLAKNRLMRNEQKIHNVKEGNAFTGALYQARQEGKTEFEFNGKTYPVKEANTETIEEVIKMKKSMNERISPKDMDAIKSAVQSASSFMSVGSELKKLGMRYIFATSPMPVYIVQDKSGNRVGIVNKKYATKPDFVVGDIAVGIMESKIKENASRTAMEIGGLTGLNKDAIQKFVDTHNMDIEKVFQYVKKGKLTDRLNFVTAIVGTLGNPVQKRMIKMFGESVNEGHFGEIDINHFQTESLDENFPGPGETVDAKNLDYDMLDYFNRTNKVLSIDTKSKKGIKGSVGKMYNNLVFNGDSIAKKDIIRVKILEDTKKRGNENGIVAIKESVNKSLINEEMSTAFLILMNAAIVNGLLIGQMAASGGDGGFTPIADLKAWWNKRKSDKALKSIIAKIKNDKDVVEFMKLTPSQQRGKFRSLIATKLSSDELEYLNKINRSHFKNESVNEISVRAGLKLRTYLNGRSDIVDYELVKPNYYNAVKGGKTNLFKVINSTHSKIKVGSTEDFSTDDVKAQLKAGVMTVLKESVNEAKAGDFEMGDFVHFKSANKTGMVKKISGDMVTIMTMKGEFTGNIKDVKVLYQDGVNLSVNEAAMSDIDINHFQTESLDENFPGPGETVDAKNLDYDMLDYFNRTNKVLSIDTKSKKGIKGSVGKMYNNLVFNGDSIAKKDIIRVKILEDTKKRFDVDFYKGRNSEKSPLSVNEAAMSDIDIIAQEAKDFKDFLKEFYKEYKDFPKTKESLKWLAGVYKNRSKTEGLETDEN